MAFLGILLIVLGTAIIFLLGIQGLTLQQAASQVAQVFGIAGPSGPSEPEGPGGRTSG